MKKLLLAILTSCLLVLPTTAHAEHSVGFAAGATTGLGASYRYLSDTSPWGWQVTGLPIVNSDSGVLSLGAKALYILNRGRTVSAYASLGIGTLYNWDNCTEDDSFCKDEEHFGLGAGPGIGFELRMLDNVAWSVDIPLAVIYADGDFHGLLPVPNSSVVYYW
jgi:hypothetical protein